MSVASALKDLASALYLKISASLGRDGTSARLVPGAGSSHILIESGSPRDIPEPSHAILGRRMSTRAKKYNTPGRSSILRWTLRLASPSELLHDGREFNRCAYADSPQRVIQLEVKAAETLLSEALHLATAGSRSETP